MERIVRILNQSQRATRQYLDKKTGEQKVIIVDDALEAHLPLILLQKEPIGEYWKPAKSRFYACAAGHLLILAPWVIDGSSDYASFHQLNDYAREICEATEMRIIDYPNLTRT